MAEASNLISQIAETTALMLRQTPTKLIDTQTKKFEPGKTIATHESFLRLGLTDCAILRMVENKVPVITTDLDLYLVASKKNYNVINFTYLRQERLLSI